MPQKYGHRANEVQSAQLLVCEICGANPIRWTWSDKHGEAMCTRCGTPYQILQRDSNRKLLPDATPRINIKKEWIPVLKRYWGEKQAFMGLGTIMIWRDYPECAAGQKKFYAWVDAHEEIVPLEKEK